MRARKPLAEADINLTPLIDVVFVILIMFIVVAPLLEIERIELADGPPLDEKSAVLAQEAGELTIHVFADDSLTVNKQPVSPGQLKSVLTYAKQKLPKARPQVFHDRKATFGTYQAVKNALEAAGFSEMDVVLKPE